jgi:hypothetical protein
MTEASEQNISRRSRNSICFSNFFVNLMLIYEDGCFLGCGAVRTDIS